MGYIKRTDDKRVGSPAVLIALILALVLFGTLSGPAPSYAAAIGTCGGCHGSVGTSDASPRDGDAACRLPKKNHPAHATGTVYTTCSRCHPATNVKAPTKVHINGLVNITSTDLSAPGMRYSTTTTNCTNACHKNRDAKWNGLGSDCNICHFRSGALGNVVMPGLHVTSDRSWKHYSSSIKVNGKSISCSECHPVFSNDTTFPMQHIKEANFTKRADMTTANANVTTINNGYSKVTGTCATSCHYNASDPFGNYTICFKPGQKKRFGPYQSASWAVDTDLKCNECHSTPSLEATFGHATSFKSKNANKRHQNHLFSYKMNPFNFPNEDRNIYCDDCHKTPDINAVRGFQHHSTIGENNSKIISLPVKSQNARVDLKGGMNRNNGLGRDKSGPPVFMDDNAALPADKNTCSNVYCHTIMTKGGWTDEGCNACHGKKDGVDIGSGAPGYKTLTSLVIDTKTFEEYSGGGGAHYSHVMKRGYACRTCHYDGGGDGDPTKHHDVNPRTVAKGQVNVGVEPEYWFNNKTSMYDRTTRSCNNVRCHFGSSQNWDCNPLH